MKKIKIFLFNAFGIAGVNIALRFVSVSFNAYLAEKVGAEGMGLFSLVGNVFGFAVIVACSGVNLAAVRLASEKSAILERAGADRKEYRKCASSVIRSCVVYSLLFSVAASAVLFLFAGFVGGRLLGDERCVASVRVLSVCLPAISLTSALSGYFTGMRKAYKNAVTTVVAQFVKIAFTSTALALAAPSGSDPVEYACLAVVGGSAVSEGFSLIVNAVLYFTDSKVPAGASTGRGGGLRCADMRASLSDAARISLPTAVGSYARTGLVTVEHLLIPWGLKKNGAASGAALASYGVIQGMVFPLILFPAALTASFSSLLIPEVSSMAATGNKSGVRKTADRALSVALSYSVGVAAVFIMFSSELGMGLYSNETACREILIMAPLIPVMYLDSATDAFLKGLGAQLDSMKINLIDASCSLVLVLILVPSFGIYGYMATVYFCEILNFILSFMRLGKVSGSTPRIAGSFLFSVAAAFSCCLCMKLVPTLFRGSAIPTALRIAAFSLLYFLAVSIFFSKKKDDSRRKGKDRARFCASLLKNRD